MDKRDILANFVRNHSACYAKKIFMKEVNAKPIKIKLSLNVKNKLLKQWDIEKYTDLKNIPLILLPGRLTDWKGQEMFIEALHNIKKEMPDKEFFAVILGSDQGRKVYKKKLIRLVEQYRLQNYIKFIDNCELIEDIIFTM